MTSTLLIILGAVAGLSLLIWLGTRILPQPFSPYSEESPAVESIDQVIAIPEGLPEPVARFYQVLFGDRIPIIESFILTGRGRLRFKGVTMPARLRFIHQAGQGYRHYIETTIWGFPVLRVNEFFLNWHSRLALPFGVIENEPQVDEAANLGLWSETMMFPGVYLSTSGVQWEGIDQNTARLIVPFKDGTDSFTVYFNEQTGLIDLMESMRWKNPGDSEKTLWQAQAREWGQVQGWKMPVLFAAQWMDEESPWLIARIEEAAWNVELSDYMISEGI